MQIAECHPNQPKRGCTYAVHLGLREGRLVQLVVSEPSVAHNVDDDIIAPLLPPLCRKLEHVHHRLHVITVHVEDGGVQRLGHVSAVGGGAAVLRVGCEGNLQIEETP